MWSKCGSRAQGSDSEGGGGGVTCLGLSLPREGPLGAAAGGLLHAGAGLQAGRRGYEAGCAGGEGRESSLSDAGTSSRRHLATTEEKKKRTGDTGLEFCSTRSKETSRAGPGTPLRHLPPR